MTMDRVLFILPSYEMGGTTSSVINLINLLHGKFSIDLLVMAHEGPRRALLSERCVFPADRLLTALVGNIRNYKSGQQVAIDVPVKLLRRVCCWLGRDLSAYVFQRVAKCIATSEYSAVVACQEGAATHFASHLQHSRR